MINWKRSIVPCVASVPCLLVPAVRGQTLTVPVQGAEQVTSGGTADLGSLTVTAAGHSESVSFGKFSSAASVASGLAAKFSLDCQSPVSAFAQGAQITFTLKSSGPSVSISSAAQWDTADFSASSFHLPSAGGGAPTPTPGQPTSSLSLDCTPDPAPAGAAVSCTAEMPAGVTGSLSFSVDGGPPSEVALSSGGSASLGTLSGLAAGSHTVTASYPGDANYAATTQTSTVQVLAGSLQPVPVYSFSITQPGGTTSGYAANGNLTAYADSVNGQWSLGYDGLNRVTGAGSQGFANQAQQYMCWAYDSFGNRTVEATASSAFGGSCSSSNPSSTNQVSYNTNNQITGGSALPSAPSYDAGGNVINDGTIQYLYDGEGRICAISKGIMPGTSSMTQYIYDADGNRVAKGSIATFSCDTTVNGFQPSAAYALDQSGQQVTEMTVNGGQSSWAHTNLFTAGGLYATYDLQGLHYQINDWLGTRRVQTDAFGQVEENCQSLPFGNGLNCPNPANAPTTAEDATEHHFTGKERDAETNNDYFGARYYGSTMGRWISPDWSAEPVPVPYADIGEPQSLNLYGYVKNNPLSMADPDGHASCCDVLPTMTEVDAGIAYLEGAATAGAEFTISAVAAPVVAIGGLFLSPAQAGNDPAERRYLMMSKGGKQNVRHTQFDDYTDEELEAIIKDPNALPSLKQKAIATLKGRRQRNQQKRGGGNNGGNGGRGGNNNNAGNNNNNSNRGAMGMVPFFVPDQPPPPPPPPKDKHGEPN